MNTTGRPVRVLLVAVKDLAGGAHRSAFRLHQSLRAAGVESTMVVREKASTDPNVQKLSATEMGWPRRGRGALDRLPSFCLTSADEPISLGLHSIRLGQVISRLNPDVVHLHWVNGGIVSIEAAAAAAVGRPVLWTLHDMWAFTGGCHYAGECSGYRHSCESCPKIRSLPIVKTAASWVHRRKAQRWTNRPMFAVAPSRWMAQAASESTIFRQAAIKTIPYCIDPRVFNPILRESARARLGIATDDYCLLFVNANQRRKGAALISRAISEMQSAAADRRIRYLFAGGLPENLNAESTGVCVLPPTYDEMTMAGYFSAADLFVMPSLEDNLPNAIIEALACGTPVVAFPTGGIPEMIVPGRNGVLAEAVSTEALLKGIVHAQGAKLWPRHQIAAAAHATYNERTVAEAHTNFYAEIMAEIQPELREYCR